MSQSGSTTILVGGNMGRNDGVDYRAKLAADFPEVTFISYEGQPEIRERHIAEADAVIGDVPDALLPRAQRLRWVQTTGAGANAVCTPGMIAREGIVGTSCVGVHVASVPEQTLAMVFAFARCLPEQIINQHTAHRFYWPTAMFELEGQTMAILGLGYIGRSLAQKAKGLGMRVTGWRRSDESAPDGLLDRQFAPDDLRGLLADADHVVICLPLTPETKGLIGAAELRLMKQSAFLYNVGRGAIVDQDALIAALKAGTIAGCGTDVPEPEPLPADHPLVRLSNCVVVPHIASASKVTRGKMAAMAAANLLAGLRGEHLATPVNPEVYE